MNNNNERKSGIRSAIAKAKSPEELQKIVEDFGGYMAGDIARATFYELNPHLRELSEGDLSDISGGADLGYEITRICDFWACMNCGHTAAMLGQGGFHDCTGVQTIPTDCTGCAHAVGSVCLRFAQ